MIQKIRAFWNEHPLTLIMSLAIIFRLVSIIFARGWGMIDDHFLVIEASQSWVDGYDYNSWLPGSPDNHGPTGHNFFYPGIHFLLFAFFKLIHLSDPQLKMIIVRLLHASFSLLTVWYGYRITEKIGSKKAAAIAGLLIAIYWFMPWMSVRNLAEMVSIPFLVLSIWFIVREEHPRRPILVYMLAGLFFGFAFILRPQTASFAIGVGIALLISRKWKEAVTMIPGFLLPPLLFQGGVDYFIWGQPFVEVSTYIGYNLSGKDAYIVLPWYNYFLVILGLLIPPVSLFLFFGYLRSWKKHFLIFLPVALFFILHSYIANKQERFILPVIPFIIMLGSIGWLEFSDRSVFWAKHRKLLRGCWIFFWIINLALLPFVTGMYSKRARVESMAYLSRYPDISEIMVADQNNKPELFPLFYLNQWPHIYEELKDQETTDSLLVNVSKMKSDRQPRFILFTGDDNLSERIIKARQYFPYLVYETTIETGLVDKVMHRLNPINKNKRVYIYRNTAFIPKKL